jgi:UDP-N-acetylmuramoylalanine-D-glutamate ligase
VTIKNNDGKEFTRGPELEDAWITRLTRCLAKRESARVQYHDCEDAVTAALHYAKQQGVSIDRIESVLTTFHEGSRY